MVVINLSNCPKGLKGDLSKWMIEISTGTFVGNLNGRIRDQLWDRICSLLKDGQATMAYTSNCEQKIKFRVFGTDWYPVDYDGLVLMKKPSHTSISRNEKKLNHADPVAKPEKDAYPISFIVIDCETTGLNPEEDDLLEIGALKIKNGVVIDQFQALIHQETPIPAFISKLTGLDDEYVIRNGIQLKDAILGFAEFLEDYPVLGYNVGFDMDFLKTSAEVFDVKFDQLSDYDVLDLARKKLSSLPDRKLTTVAQHLKVSIPEIHRAIADCFTTLSVFQKLKDL